MTHAQLLVEHRYLQDVLAWLVLELDDAADAIDPVPDLAEKCLRSIAQKLGRVIDEGPVDLGPFGPKIPAGAA